MEKISEEEFAKCMNPPALTIQIPVKVGDIVYQLNKSLKKIEAKVIGHIHIEIGFNEKQYIHYEFQTCGCCRDSDFGKTIFTNKIDAIKAYEAEFGSGNG